jgi:dTDP-4-amino-4,6-dideoxy-D-galactose acyltransferase
MIKALEWESAFFGFPIGEIRPGMPIDIDEIEGFLSSGDPTLVQSLVSLADVARIRNLEDAGFRLVDVRTSFQFAVAVAVPPRRDIRRATAEDIPHICSLARDLFYESRYFCGPFPRERSRALFATWAEKAVLGTFDDACLVATHVKGVAGFVTMRAGDPARIGLIGVHPEMQGRGIASALVDAALAWAADERTEVLNVSTQGRNIRAQNLYIGKGARLQEIHLWFYRASRPDASACA